MLTVVVNEEFCNILTLRQKKIPSFHVMESRFQENIRSNTFKTYKECFTIIYHATVFKLQKEVKYL